MARYSDPYRRPGRDWEHERQPDDWRDEEVRPRRGYARYDDEPAAWERGYDWEQEAGPQRVQRRYGRGPREEVAAYGTRDYGPYRGVEMGYGYQHRPEPYGDWPRAGSRPAGPYGAALPADLDWLRPGPFTGRGPRDYQRSDDRIREEICERLTLHGDLDASEISVRVRHGEVTLAGLVDSRAARRLAEDLADTVVGVRHVDNQLRVRPRDERPFAADYGDPRRERRDYAGAAPAWRAGPRPGMPVVGSDAERVGHVKELGEQVLVVERAGKRDLQVPLTAVRDVLDDQVLLAIPAGRVDQLGWEPTPLVGAPERR
jgi:hypothetical protein